MNRLLWELFDGVDEDCRGTLSVLSAGGRPVASHFGLRGGSRLAYWFPAYDPAFARYSPGVGLLLRIAQDGVRELDCIDMGKGDEPYKLALGTRRYVIGEAGSIAGRSLPWPTGFATSRNSSATA